MKFFQNHPLLVPFWTLFATTIVLFTVYLGWGLWANPGIWTTAGIGPEMARALVFVVLSALVGGFVYWVFSAQVKADITAAKKEQEPVPVVPVEVPDATQSEETAARDKEIRLRITQMEEALRVESSRRERAEKKVRELEALSGPSAHHNRGVFEAFLSALDGQVQSRLDAEEVVHLSFSTTSTGLGDVTALLKRWTSLAPELVTDELEAAAPDVSSGLEKDERPGILVAEDDPVSRQILKGIFSREPAWNVRYVANGVQAWEALVEGFDPSVCVFDHLMPGLDGLGVVQRMRKDLRFMETGVIMCTASRNRDNISKAGSLRIAHYLVKPYKATAVLETVREVLQRVESTRNATVEQLGMSSGEYAEMLETLRKDVAKAADEARAHFLGGRTQRAVLNLQRVQSAAISLRQEVLASGLGKLATAYEEKSFEDAARQWDQLQLALGELDLAGTVD